jgi:hypothetical protein
MGPQAVPHTPVTQGPHAKPQNDSGQGPEWLPGGSAPLLLGRGCLRPQPLHWLPHLFLQWPTASLSPNVSVLQEAGVNHRNLQAAWSGIYESA